MDKAHKEDVVYKNRYDVTVLINGLPMIQIELKRPVVWKSTKRSIRSIAIEKVQFLKACSDIYSCL